MRDDQIDVYELHREVHGVHHFSRLVDQAVEELAELTVALAHFQRGRCGTDHVVEEYTDVIICMDAIMDAFIRDRAKYKCEDCVANDLNHAMAYKLQRLKNRLTEMKRAM